MLYRYILSQSWPPNPVGQAHTACPRMLTEQFPPFWHCTDEQASTETENGHHHQM